jgi:hypothetical protein
VSVSSLAQGANPQAYQNALETAPVDLLANVEGDTYDSHPSLAVLPDGSTWMAWHAYHRAADRILARRLGPGEPKPVQVLSRGHTVCGPPVLVSGGGESAWAFWATKFRDRWWIWGSRAAQGEWQPFPSLADSAADCIWPAAIHAGGDRVVLSWCARHEGTFRVESRTYEDGVWQWPATVSDPRHNAFRSALAADDQRGTWIFWDSYQDGRYAVWGKRLSPEPGPAERMSPEGQNCLQPTALAAKSGLYVAWVRVADVMAGEGAISQWHTLDMAVREDGRWQPIRDPHGGTAGATLTHGLLARMEPEPVPTGGYLGRRRHPMLLEDGDAVWLLWERKSEHRGSTPATTGELVGRRSQGGTWQEPVVLHQVLLDYHLAQPPRAQAGKFFYVASDLPRKGRRLYHRRLGDLSVSTPFEQDDWPGWKPVKLPLAEEHDRRHEIRDGRATYRLYWGDLHCHTGLTADAEGEPDELVHYARDRARLDVVVMTENDHIFDCFLTEGEFALDHFFAGAFTREGSFVALPGYEWTSRLPKSADVARADPRNWTYPHWRESYPNHRTIIYPPAGGPVVRHPEVENDIRKLNDAVLAAGGLTLTQHATWDLTGHPVEVGVEVTSGWGIYISNPEHVHEALDEGHRFGLVGNGDSHRRNPGLCGGLTGIYAERLTPEAILDALRNRRVYATNGSRIVVDSRANGGLMGREVRAAEGTAEITLSVIGTRPIVTATLIRDGKEVKTFEGDGTQKLSAVYRDVQLPQGTHWYYWRIAQEGTPPSYPGNVKVARGHLAWSSPHWVKVE